jgi:hypothetical protein
MHMKINRFLLGGTVALLLMHLAVQAADRVAMADRPQAILNYLPARAYHIPPETTTEECGFYALCEGNNGRIYIGTAAYGRNAYLVEFDPKTEEMRIVLDTHQLLGLPLEPTGFAAQSSIHSRLFVGTSGKVYLGSMQGYPNEEERKTGKIPPYLGGHVMTYNPATGKAQDLGMPMPKGDPRQQSHASAGQGVIDVVADETRGLIYVITVDDHHWMLYDTKHPEKGYRHLGPVLVNSQPNTLIDRQGRATAITRDYQIARYDPATGSTTIDELLLGGEPFRETLDQRAGAPDWRLAPDGRTAYLQFMSDLRLFRIDLGGRTGKPVHARSLGNRIEGKRPDSRGSLTIAPDGKVYSAVRVDNDTGFGSGYLHHIVQYDPKTGKMADLGVLAVQNPDFFDFEGPQQKNADGSLKPRHGFHRLPDGTLTPLHNVTALIIARDGTLYATVIYPFTLLRIPPPL